LWVQQTESHVFFSLAGLWGARRTMTKEYEEPNFCLGQWFCIQNVGCKPCNILDSCGVVKVTGLLEWDVVSLSE
jgi:hypothetical protein